MNPNVLKLDVLFTSIYAFIHFVVDFSCVFTVTLCSTAASSGSFSIIDAVVLIVIYDLVAFALQMPIGAILDGINKNINCARLAVILILAGYIIFVGSSIILSMLFYPPEPPFIDTNLPFIDINIIPVLMVAIGNAIFHCAGGIDILNIAKGRTSLPGVFIGTGALGVFLAPLIIAHASSLSMIVGNIFLALPVVLLIVSERLLSHLNKVNKTTHYSNNATFEILALSPQLAIAFACLFVTVLIRSYAGLSMAFPWKGEIILAVIAVLAVVCGKAFGGFIADKFGLLKTSVISLGLASVLFFFSWDVPVCGILATFLFNFTMPITLTVMANIFPKAKGFAFGTATFALALGFVPIVFSLGAINPVALAILSIISLVALSVGLKMYENSCPQN